MAPPGLLRDADGFARAHDEVFGSLRELTADLDDERGALPTGCPGWTVRDCLAHVAALESLLAGRPQPEHTAPELPHVRNDMGRLMEAGVDLRRARPLREVVDELLEVMRERSAWLHALGDADLDTEVQGIVRRGPLRLQLDIRVFDLWSHEQDIRRALQRSGGLEGLAAAHSRERMIRGGVARAAAAVGAEQAVVAVDVTGRGGAQRTLRPDDGHHRVSEGLAEDATVTLRLDLPTLTVLACGRCDDPQGAQRVQVAGDLDLGRRLLGELAFTP